MLSFSVLIQIQINIEIHYSGVHYLVSFLGDISTSDKSIVTFGIRLFKFSFALKRYRFKSKTAAVTFLSFSMLIFRNRGPRNFVAQV
jgi:hypothetical protein